MKFEECQNKEVIEEVFVILKLKVHSGLNITTVWMS